VNRSARDELDRCGKVTQAAARRSRASARWHLDSPHRKRLQLFPHSLTQPRVLKYRRANRYHFSALLTPHRRASLRRAFGRLREIVGVRSDQYGTLPRKPSIRF